MSAEKGETFTNPSGLQVCSPLFIGKECLLDKKLFTKCYLVSLATLASIKENRMTCYIGVTLQQTAFQCREAAGLV